MPWEAERRYDVFDSTGAWLGAVDLPPGHEPLEIGSDYLIAAYRDDLYVEFVAVYALRRVC